MVPLISSLISASHPSTVLIFFFYHVLCLSNFPWSCLPEHDSGNTYKSIDWGHLTNSHASVENIPVYTTNHGLLLNPKYGCDLTCFPLLYNSMLMTTLLAGIHSYWVFKNLGSMSFLQGSIPQLTPFIWLLQYFNSLVCAVS